MFLSINKGGEKGDKISGVIWNMLGGGLVACQSAVVLIFISRYYGQETAGMVSMGYALAILAYTVGKYGVRNYQVTDSDERYRFHEYVVGRWLTVTVSAFFVSMYILIQYVCFQASLTKTIILFEIMLLRMVNAVEDVYLGRMQQQGFFAIGAKIMAIREMFILATLIGLMLIGLDIKVVLLLGFAGSGCLDIFLINRSRFFIGAEADENERIRPLAIKKLLAECLPLCISTSIAIYVSNLPKYVTDWYLDDYRQAIIGYLILPVFTIALFNQFIYMPFIRELGVVWSERRIQEFIRKIAKQSLLVIAISICVLVAFLWIGIYWLSSIYLVDLKPYAQEFAVLLCGGGFYALEQYLAVPITVMHKQKEMVFGYIIVIILAVVIQKKIVNGYGLLGVSILYVITNLAATIWFAIILAMGIVRQNREEDGCNEA